MLEKQKDIDAVIVATPDHMHAVIASAAMMPASTSTCRSRWLVGARGRHLAKKAEEKKVVAQRGNQRHSGDDNRRAVEYLRPA